VACHLEPPCFLLHPGSPVCLISLLITYFIYMRVGIATGYGLDDQGVGDRIPVGARIFTSLRRSDRIWGPPSLLFNRYRGIFPRG
jgi:hypothetical protein